MTGDELLFANESGSLAGNFTGGGDTSPLETDRE